MLRDTKFDTLRRDKGVVFDKGGYGVKVSWADKNFGMSDSGGTISNGSQEAWGKVVAALEAVGLDLWAAEDEEEWRALVLVRRG